MSDFGHISIKAGDLKGLAEKIEQVKRDLSGRFDDIKTQMNSLEQDGWSSESGRALRQKFTTLHTKYHQQYPPSMDAYIRFLNDTADTYERNEQDRMREVESMKDSFR
jgi:uncharacterized protein YukE